ncbi:Acetyltransferase [Trichoplax sp. H2]|nr:Acetyltransferase [Trichoplax sp. H2]|eukprot:RDD41614.1 Acetyltransferase [Trichoplax sp. H2]
MNIIHATTLNDFSEIVCLFQEFRDFANIDGCRLEMAEETKVESLPGIYAPPKGRLFLVSDDGNAAGCVGLAELEPGICELKHLYVRSKFQGKKLGRKLVETAIQEARSIGYTQMRLSTREMLKAAISLYNSLGFKQTRRYIYQHDPVIEFVDLELDLTQ